MIEILSERIWNRPAFQAEYRALLRESLTRSFKIERNIDDTAELSKPIDQAAVRRLLQSATHFAATEQPKYREAAYRIAVASWSLFAQNIEEFNNLREIVHIILGRLGNFPAVDFLFRDIGVEHRGQTVPLAVWLEIEGHAMANSVKLTEQVSLKLTDFQRSLWDILERRLSAAVTAPTSAGKSYALEHYLASTLRDKSERWGIYVVPTRALINQVSGDLLETSARISHGALAISTIPVSPKELGMLGGIYVLTQERLQILLDATPDLRFDLAVIDEAQMLAEPSRGVILQTVVEELLSRAPDTQLLFGSPQTKNPEIFGHLFERDDIKPLPPPERPVAQNIIFVNTDSIQRNLINISAEIENHRDKLGTIVLDTELLDEDHTLAFLSFSLGLEEKNLVYAGGKAKCEDIAAMLRQLIEERKAKLLDTDRSTLQEFASFIRSHVHPEYALASVITEGVAFHYGNMPALVRKTVEELFSEGKLSFLVCTSTLLHGVNLPAKNLFLMDPTKGREWITNKDIPITSIDFWNLAGRAGRLGKEFEGNVFLINYERWQSKPLENERDQSVTPSSEEVVVNKRENFLAFIRDREHSSGANSAAENMFVKLVNESRAGKLEKTLSRMFHGLDEAAREEVRLAVEIATKSINVPEAITRKNITVSVFRQQEMLDYLVPRIGEIGPEQLIPLHPAQRWEDAHKSFIRLFKRIHTYFEKLPKDNKSHAYFAPLALRWMRGDPLPRLLDDAITYRQKQNPNTSTPRIIRDTLDDIENDLRFRYVKYTSCYCDLLKEALQRTAHTDLVERIPAIALFLELGASSRTMINLVGLGLSRMTASLVAAKAANKNMERPEAQQWLLRENWNESDLSRICVKEIRRVLAAL